MGNNHFFGITPQKFYEGGWEIGNWCRDYASKSKKRVTKRPGWRFNHATVTPQHDQGDALTMPRWRHNTTTVASQHDHGGITIMPRW